MQSPTKFFDLRSWITLDGTIDPDEVEIDVLTTFSLAFLYAHLELNGMVQITTQEYAKMMQKFGPNKSIFNLNGTVQVAEFGDGFILRLKNGN
jgi:hypothetical protein